MIEMAPHRRTSSSTGGAETQEAGGERELSVCPRCSSEFVHPTDWHPVSTERWRVELRCPECEWIASEVHDQAIMDTFDETLDQGTDDLIGDLCELSRAIMEEEAARFTDALRRDLILPEDF